MEESSSPSPSSSSSALGFAALPAVASRGRGRGRPPKLAVASASAASPLANSDGNSPAAASPTPSSLDADADGSPSECRRSSRKKIIKFDVRDLLNKNRKAHKIQIEARIDSNPNTNPSSSSAASPGSVAPVGTASNRLFSMFESSHQSLPPPPPPPHALEIFAKPRPTQSLIVAQVTSEPSAVVQTVAALPVVAVRKRGRPRKSAPVAAVAAAAAPTAPSCSDSDTNSNSTTTSTSTGSGSGSGSGGEAGTGVAAVPTKRKSKLRVTLKRLNLSRRQESSDSGDTPLNITVMGPCTSPPSSSSSVGEPLALQDENALDEQPEKQQQQPQEQQQQGKEVATILVPGDNSDSDSEIIFIEIETSEPGKEDDPEQEQEQTQGLEVLPPAEAEEIEIDLDKQDSMPAPEQDLEEIMVEVLSEPPSLWSAEDDDEEAEEQRSPAAPEGEPESTDTSSPAPRRSRRSAQLSGSSRQGKTLEETFAEIAAESSKQILESEESQGNEEEQHVLIDLIEDSQSEEEQSQRGQEVKEQRKSEQEVKEQRKSEQEEKEQRKSEQEEKKESQGVQELDKQELKEHSQTEQELKEKNQREQELKEQSQSKQELKDQSPYKQELKEQSQSEQALKDQSLDKQESKEQSQREQELKKQSQKEEELKGPSPSMQQLKEQSQSEQKLKVDIVKSEEVSLIIEVIPKRQEFTIKTVSKPAKVTAKSMEMAPSSSPDESLSESKPKTEATPEPKPRKETAPEVKDQPQVSPKAETMEDTTKSLPELTIAEAKPESQTKEDSLSEEKSEPQPREESTTIQQIVVVVVGDESKQTEAPPTPTPDQMSNDESDTSVETEQARKLDRSEITSIHAESPTKQYSIEAAAGAAPDETKISSEESEANKSPMDTRKRKKESQAKKSTGRESKKDAAAGASTYVPEHREPKKSLSENLNKKEKETDRKEKVTPPRESPAEVNAKKETESEKSPPEASSGKPKEAAKPSKGPASSRKETERDKSSPESQKKKEHRQSPSELMAKKEKGSRKSSTSSPTEQTPSETAKAPPPAPAEQPKKPPPTSDPTTASKPKDKIPAGFVECDAMFKAMDMANAQMRLEEKSKKKIKKVPPKVVSPPPVAATVVASASSSPPATTSKKPLGRKAASCRRNTVYEDSPKLERSSSPGSDSANNRVTTPVGKTKRPKARNKPNPRRSTISEEAHERGKNLSTRMEVISPNSSSSDSFSKRNAPKKDAAAASKLELRRNTICEERQAETSPAIPLARRRYSLHPKASADLLPDINKSAGKKRGRKPAAKLNRQDSLDSSSSASQGRVNKRKPRKSTEILHAELLETESSQSSSTSSGSKMQRIASPDLDGPDTLKDIAKFIEDGVNLLKRDYKVAEDEEEKEKKPKAEPNAEEDEFTQRVANMETPDTTLSPSPTQSNPEEASSMTNPLQESNSNDSNGNGNGNGGVRRSHRIKQKPQGPKASQGRGVTSMALAPISMDEQLAELAHIEAINEQFLRSEGLNTFQALRENYYRCARQVSQENAEMQCDCFLTGDEEAQGHLCCGAGCINRMLMIECGPLCTNGDRCTNKRFQQHKCWPCRVFRTEKKGCGITAELQIPPGEFIMEYVGEVIDSEEFERRQHLYSKDRKRHYYFMALRGEAIIDATSKGNISRFINHSCDPNAETQKWTVNGELRIGFFSVKPIQPGEEITFDYQYQRYGKDAQRCYCEATNCRGWIGGEPDSDEGEQLDAESDSEATLEDEELEVGADQEAGESRKLTKAKTPSKSKVKLPTASANRKRKEQQQIKPKDREYKAGRWLKPSAAGGAGSGEKSSRKPKVSKFHAMLEDPDVLEELTRLSRSGLKNQLDTLRFSRCMVRAKLLQTRLQLLVLLTRGELPCRRLFLDYHGLRLLHAWISESGNDIQLRMALLEALESLPIPNRTMLNDSRVYQSVQLWSGSLEQQSEPPAGGEDLHKRMVALLQKWQALPEIFRIPKRERIEQMKEHEREADRQQKHAMHASTALEDQREQRESTSDRYRQDRFRRDTTSTRTGKPIRMSGNNTICTITTQPKGSNGAMDGMARNDNRRRSDMGGPSTEPRRTLSKELRRSLFERKVALDEAEKRVCSEDWREHELRCEFFGMDLKTVPKQLPFYQNTETGEWFNSEDMPVVAPQRTDLALLSPEEEASGPVTAPAVEYKLPAGVDPLPPAWNWRMTPDGDIYYYNLRERISQWEPPSAEQRLQTLLEEDAAQHPLHELQNDPELLLATELIQVDSDYVGSLSTKSLAQYVEAKVKERREIRRSRLVSVRVISPRRDEDRLYNQLESRKYKENKEKIRRRKEIYRRRRPDAVAAATATVQTGEDGLATNSLPIQGYLYSSDEEAADPTAAPVAGETLGVGTKVDELEALNMGPSTSQAAALAALAKDAAQSSGSTLGGGKRKLPMPPHVPENKKQRPDNRAKRAKSPLVPPASMREAHEKFRFDVSGLVAEILRPYRKESCRVGRICSDEDYKFLIKRLSQHITAKEMRYCDASGHVLLCSESVRHKSYDFIHQYMRKKGRIYRKPAEAAPI